MGDTIHNQIGDISNVSGQVFVGQFRDVITNLNTAGQSELAQALKALQEAVITSTALSADKKQEQVEVIHQIAEEATKPKPNKTLLKMLGDGLITALKAVPDIAGAAAAIAPVLSQLHL